MKTIAFMMALVAATACGSVAGASLAPAQDKNFVQTGTVGYHSLTLYGYACIEAIGGDGSQYDNNGDGAYNPKGIGLWCDPNSKAAK